MKAKWRQTLISVFISSSLIFGGVALTVLLVLVTSGPGFPDSGLSRYMIITLSSVSFILSGVFGFISALRGVNSRMYGFHISMETLFLLLAITAFISFQSSVMTYNIDECSEVKSNGTCICGDKTKSVFKCEDVPRHAAMTYTVNILYLVMWGIAFADLMRSMCISCCLKDEELPGVIFNEQKT